VGESKGKDFELGLLAFNEELKVLRGCQTAQTGVATERGKERQAGTETRRHSTRGKGLSSKGGLWEWPQERHPSTRCRHTQGHRGAHH